MQLTIASAFSYESCMTYWALMGDDHTGNGIPSLPPSRNHRAPASTIACVIYVVHSRQQMKETRIMDEMGLRFLGSPSESSLHVKRMGEAPAPQLNSELFTSLR